MTGHGNIAFTTAEARRLKTYLENGGFLVRTMSTEGIYRSGAKSKKSSQRRN